MSMGQLNVRGFYRQLSEQGSGHIVLYIQIYAYHRAYPTGSQHIERDIPDHQTGSDSRLHIIRSSR